MSKVFDDWKKMLGDFKSSVEKDLEEIRRQKVEIQQLREEIGREVKDGLFVRDDHKIIISAPEIIIGNVDKTGDLLSTGISRIIVKGRNVGIDGVSPGGRIEMRSPKISQIAVNPGSDGLEATVEHISQVVTKASSVIIESKNETEVFTDSYSAGRGCISIHADKSIDLNASVKSDSKKKDIESKISDLDNLKSDVKSQTDSDKKAFEDLLDQMEKTLKERVGLTADDDSVKGNIDSIFENNEEISRLMPAVYTVFRDYFRNVSRLAEINRQISVLKKAKDKVPEGDEYKKNNTGAKISLLAESIDVVSADGEGNFRDNPGAGFSLKANSISFDTHDSDGSLKDTGAITLAAKNVAISTADEKNLKFEENGNVSSGEMEVKGTVTIRSKDIYLESIDYHASDNKIKEKSLSKNGHVAVRAESISMLANDTEGKSSGNIVMNAKEIGIKSIDVDKEKRTDKNLTQGSSLLLISEKMFIGGKDKDTESKLVQTASENIGVFAKETFETQQGEKKSVLQMSNGTMAISGEKTEIYGKTTVNDATEIKGELKAPKAAIDSVEAKSAFKSPNISDGMSAGGGGGGGSLSPKLQKEEIAKDEAK